MKPTSGRAAFPCAVADRGSVAVERASRRGGKPSRTGLRRLPGLVAVDEAVAVADVVKVYEGGRKPAVDGLGFAVRRGEVFSLLGPSGAGKTTTVGVLTTRVRPTSGRALVEGVDVVADPRKARQVLAVVPQRNTLDRALNVRQNLLFHAAHHGLGRAERTRLADGVLNRMGCRAGPAVPALHRHRPGGRPAGRPADRRAARRRGGRPGRRQAEPGGRLHRPGTARVPHAGGRPAVPAGGGGEDGVRGVARAARGGADDPDRVRCARRLVGAVGGPGGAAGDRPARRRARRSAW
ncbi:ATP-binding cassette domain-containing protein [Saccharothrix espanaensis]|uniref:ATP-binding cassette domain-containing protein n=1 Tax=Saccharothrix espanaensis TaxID=103731 RepID=UPI0038B5E73B